MQRDPTQDLEQQPTINHEQMRRLRVLDRLDEGPDTPFHCTSFSSSGMRVETNVLRFDPPPGDNHAGRVLSRDRSPAANVASAGMRNV
jgi:hypothetical protein